MSESENLKRLIAARGYVKASLTRNYNFLFEDAKESVLPLESRNVRKERIMRSFEEYEGYNKEIMYLDPTDKENVQEIENKYFAMLEKLSIDSNFQTQTFQKANAKLPVIDINSFSGKYTEYIPFIGLFKSIIHNDISLGELQKLHYLRSFLKGEPFDLIKNLPLADGSYNDALQMLNDRYYNKYLIINEHICELLDMSCISKPIPSQIRQFISTIRQTLAALKNLQAKVDDWDAILICIFTRKLDAQTARTYQLEQDTKVEPSVAFFLEFLEKRALAMENASMSTTGTVRQVVMNAVTAEAKQGCHYCKCSDHRIFSCKKFKLLPSAQRIEFVKVKGLCKTCLNNHPGQCKFHFRCNQCKKQHNSLIHLDENKVEPVIMLSGNNSNVLLPTARIKLYAKDGREVHVKAILDSASQASLITSKAVNVLGLTPMQNKTNLIGVTNSRYNTQFSLPLEIHSLKSPFKTMINFHVVDKITCKLPQTMIDPTTILLPPNLILADDEFYKPSEINMLIGADVFFQVLQPSHDRASLPKEHPLSEPGQYGEEIPGVINTKFGHIIAGGLPPQKTVTKLISLLCTKCDSSINNTIKKFWESEKVPEIFNENSSEQDLVEANFESTVKLINNKFQVDLPLKIPLENVNETLGNSFDLALYRFLNLEKKLHKNINLYSDYKKFINEYVALGHAHFIDFESINFNTDPVCFLPHHAVFNENSKTTRTRVVLDGSMLTSKKLSLNDILMNGPTVQRDLFDIILLYRIGDYTFNSDIKKMFRQVLVNPLHTSLQNILWRDRHDEQIKCIRLDTVTFGLKSSNYLATRCLIELANKYETQFPLASFILKNCTYVDDILYAHSDLSILLEAKLQLKNLLQLGGFELHKWSANHQETLADIPIEQQHLNEFKLEQRDCSIKALGLLIDAKNDSFVIKGPENIFNSIVTKRSILSKIAELYDPMGFVSPIVMQAKVIMQRLWLEKIDWDTPPSQQLIDQWLKFAHSLSSFKPIYLNRNIKIPKTAEAVQLIGFADAASTMGYGCCVYLRVVNQNGKVTLSLLCSKSRINPHSKSLTIPRLELNASLLLAHLMTKVHETIIIKIKIDDIYLFSDSKVALAWIKTDVTKLQPYVSNRVRVIKQLTNRWRWLYVNTQENPADYISRGVDPQQLSTCSMWWDGPTFLRNREYQFDLNISLPNDLPDLKCKLSAPKMIALVTLNRNNFLEFIENISDLNKIIRTVAYIMRFCNNVNKNKVKINSEFLSSAEIQEALLLIIKYEQEKYFITEIHTLKQGDHIKGSLKPLHPFLDDKGLLRVGGRLQNSNVSYSQKHPIILPKSSRVTELIIHHEHLRLLHAGPKLLLSQLNQRFWLVNGIRQVKKITHRCLTCFRLKANMAKQLMGSLPRQRVTASRAYQVIGIDFAGPVYLKNARIRRAVISKGYVCVFVCFITKAIHLELASDISTDTFLACFKRFISRRGLPTEVFCDNGGAFRSAANQLAELYKINTSKGHQTQIQSFSSQQGIKFHFTPSYSPVFAGLAEAAVKSMKYHLKRTIQKCLLTYEQLNTVLCQIEAILNSRPLMPINSSDITDFSYLTPGHFIVNEPLTSYPEPDISDIPMNRLKFWQLVENMKQQFWKSWHKQYLNTLQCRPKWRDEFPNVTVGMLVLLREPNTQPLYWPMARVVTVYPGGDGKVRAFDVMLPNGKKYKRSLSSICILPINDK